MSSKLTLREQILQEMADKDRARDRDRMDRDRLEKIERERMYRKRRRSRSISVSSSRSRSKSASSVSRSYSKSRSRSKERLRSRSPAQFGQRRYKVTNNPATIGSRVFIRRLPSDLIVIKDLEDAFKVYGDVDGCSIHRGYGFVQFAKEEHARRAVAAMDGALFKGNNLEVCMAAEGHNKNKVRHDRDRDRDRFSPPPNDRSYSRGRDRSPSFRGPPPFRHDDFYPHGPPADRHYPPADPYFDRRDPYDRYPMPAPPPRYTTPPAPQPTASRDRPLFDCELVVASGQQRGYAEMIMRRLTAANLTADVNVLDKEEDVPKAIDMANRHGLLYGVVIFPQNEVHRSVTVNIFHGTPQEHRNMPLDDALNMIIRNFDVYMKEKQAASQGRSMPFSPPDFQTNYYLHLLADNRVLSLEEVNQCLEYLRQRKETLLRAQGRTAEIPVAIGAPPAAPKPVMVSDASSGQQQLQAKILSFLNGTEQMTSRDSYYDKQPQAPTSNEAMKLAVTLDNPNVQKALDDLMSTGLRSINSSMPSASQAMYTGADHRMTYSSRY